MPTTPPTTGSRSPRRLLGRPFIFLTAYDDLHAIRRATRTQPSGYLIKPVNNATLFAAIQMAIERFQTQQEAALPVPAVQPVAPISTWLPDPTQMRRLQYSPPSGKRPSSRR